MTLANDLAAANIARSDNRALLEDTAFDAAVSTIRGRLIGSSRDGHTFETDSGGTITVPRTANDAANFSPNIGAVYQVSLTGGAITRLDVASRPQSQTTEQVVQGRSLVNTRPPVNGQDVGNVNDVWIYLQGAVGGYDIASYWRWIQATGRWAPIGSGTGPTSGQFQSPSVGQILCPITSSDSRYVVAELVAKVPGGITGTPVSTVGSTDFTVNGTTLQSNVAVGSELAIGDGLEVSVTAAGSSAVSFTVKLVSL